MTAPPAHKPRTDLNLVAFVYPIGHVEHPRSTALMAINSYLVRR
jgi:hypothetical protein